MGFSKVGREAQQHALENPVILKRIFRCLIPISASAQLLERVRLVSRSWHRESLPLWRKSAVLLLQEPPLFTAVECQGVSPSHYWAELQNPESPYQLKEMPFQKYKLQKLTIDVGICSQTSQGNAFWSAMGPHIRQLTIHDVKFDVGCVTRFHAGHEEKVLVHWICSTLPNLEVLDINGVSYNETEGHWNRFSDFHRDHLPLDIQNRLPWNNGTPIPLELRNRLAPLARDCFPPLDDWKANVEVIRLEHLKVKQLSVYNSEIYASYFPNLEQLTLGSRGGLEHLLRSLNTSGDVKNQSTYLENTTIKRLDVIKCASTVCSMPLRFPALEHFAVTVDTFPNNHQDQGRGPTILIDTLETSAAVLKTLETFKLLVVPPTTVPLLQVNFPHLTELKLCGNVVWDLNFLRLVPYLRLLHLDYYGFNKMDIMRHRVLKYYGCKDLQLIPGDPVQKSVESGLMTGAVMEKLESLYINYSLEPDSIQGLGEWMPNLKILKGVFNGETLDVVYQVWGKLEELRCVYRSRIEDKDILNGGLVTMKTLRRFGYDAACNDSLLTDVCVAEGFLQISALTDLEICVSEAFSEEAEAMLEEKLQHVRVIRNYDANPHHKYWDCCEDTAYLRCVLEHGSFLRRRPEGSSQD